MQMHHLANKAKWAINSEEEKFMMTFKNQAQKVKVTGSSFVIKVQQ